MKRTLYSGAAILLALCLLAGCAPAGEGAETPAPPTASPTPAPEPTPAVEVFTFTRENFPRLDGSTSTVPLAQAICSVLLGESREDVADLTSFSRTTESYWNLMAGATDLLIAGEPTEHVMKRLEEERKWLITPFATDALVFLVSPDNPVNSLTAEQVRKIYAGEITNWSEVGGLDQEILPFQRNSQAGSQALLKKLVMGDTELMDPPADHIPTMGEMTEAVRTYDGSAGAIGYTVYYYANDMKMGEGLKLLQIDGIAPDAESIREGSYPFLNPYYVVVAKDAPEDSPQRVLYDWLLGPEGQALVAHEGYVPVLDTAAEGSVPAE